ncbi:MAG TPA: hypothetical protein VJI13_02890 [Candidatus Norongarragalinales archaeon]|nr:hypothetical protein [Candidatus Norongarragalinales archaeon]
MEKRIAIFLGLAFALIVAGIAVGIFRSPPNQDMQGAYFEIVKEDDRTQLNPSTEYLLTDSGILLSKLRYNGATQEVRIFKVGEIEAKKALAYVKGNAASQFSECTGCLKYHLFYSDSKGTIAYQSPDDAATDFVRSLPKYADLLSQNASEEETFFISLVYSKKGLIRDYHLFDDGTVVYEEFGTNPAMLMRASIYIIGEGRAKAAIAENFFSSHGENACLREEFDYGYVEAASGSNYDFVFTCGNGESPAERTFDALLKLVNEKK